MQHQNSYFVTFLYYHQKQLPVLVKMWEKTWWILLEKCVFYFMGTVSLL